VPAAGAPLSKPPDVNVTPFGSVPASVKIEVGYPDAVTWNEPAEPTVNVVFAALVIAGAWPIVNMKACVAFDPTPLLAVMVMGYVPVFAVGVPLSKPELVKVTPFGNVPVSLKDAAGYPVAVTVNEPGAPLVNVAAAALVMAGAWSTVNVKFWVAFDPSPLLAVMTME
jgi:hypothetical protein